MKIWIAKNSEVSVREQIVTQIRLGIVSGDLTPGEKLPSTRELARRFSIHANTVSSAFRELSAEGLITIKKGSGVFVSPPPNGLIRPPTIDDRLMDFVNAACVEGFSHDQIRSAVNRWLERQRGSQILLIESDLRLREIILEELKACGPYSVKSVSFEEFVDNSSRYDGVLAALFDEKDKLMPHVPAGRKAVFLKVNSVPSSLAGSGNPSDNELIAVVSGWSQFIAYARIYLLAARIDPATLILRSTGEPDWRSGLESASVIICDSYTSARLGNDPRIRTFKLLKEDSLTELKNAVL